MLSGEEISHPSVYLVFLNGELDFLFKESVKLFFHCPIISLPRQAQFSRFWILVLVQNTSQQRLLILRHYSPVHAPFTEKANGN